MDALGRKTMATLVLPVYVHVSGVEGPPQGHWTRADWESLPENGNRYEIIDGGLYMSPAPRYFHNWIVQQLYDLIGSPAKQKGLAFVGAENVAVNMPGCEPVQPDFVLVLAERASIIRDGVIWGVPDVIVEVLSPGSADYDEGVAGRLREGRSPGIRSSTRPSANCACTG
jgi:Uma2 family endonuclease